MNNNDHKNKLHAKIHEVWRRHLRLHAVLGILALFKWFALSLGTCVLIDWLLDLPALVRGIISLGIIVFAAFKAWCLGWINLKTFDPVHNALKIEEHFGNLKSLLVSAVQFGNNKNEGTENQVSGHLCELTCRSAEKAVSDLRTHETISFKALRRPASMACLMVAMIAVLAVLNGPFLKAALGRFMTPWSTVAYPSRTQIKVVGGDITVKEGEAVSIQACITGIIPAKAIIALRTDNGKPRDHDLKIVAEECEYNIKSAFRSFEYCIKAGDAKSEWYCVNVISAPKITQAKTTIKYPEYTRKESLSSEALTLTVPEGTIVSWELRLDRALVKGSFDCEGDQPVALLLSPDGLTARVTYTVASSRAYQFSWIEKSKQYAFESPKHFLQVTPDKAPRVELVSPSEDLYAIIGRKIDLAFIARDDFGISESAIIYRLNNIPEKRVQLTDSAVVADKIYQSDWDYRQHIKKIKIGDILRIGIEVKDHFPASVGPNQARSRIRRVTFLTESEYIEQLQKRKRRLLSKLRTVYRQERAAYEVVSNLSSDSESFQQSCMLEGVRQDLIKERMNLIMARIKYLIDDINANNIAAEVQVTDLQSLSRQLQKISTKHVEQASAEFRQLAQLADLDTADVSVASHAINTASREIASLVLQLGVNYAMEVLAGELQTAIQIQSSLHLKSLDLIAAPDGVSAEVIAGQQKHLAIYLKLLLAATKLSACDVRAHIL